MSISLYLQPNGEKTFGHQMCSAVNGKKQKKKNVIWGEIFLFWILLERDV